MLRLAVAARLFSVSLTLKQGVEKTLKERVPEITAVRDVTDHTNTENAYYQ